MNHHVLYYQCNSCLRTDPWALSIVNDIQTGVFIRCSGQLENYEDHCCSLPRKAANGRFLTSGRDWYESGAQNIAASGFAGFESGGGFNLYAPANDPIIIEYSGVLGNLAIWVKMPLAQLESGRHWFGYTGFGDTTGCCRDCGIRLF